MPPTYGDFDKKSQKMKQKMKNLKTRNTFLKMILVSTMVNLTFFAMNTRENWLHYAEMARHVSQIGCIMCETIKKVFFAPLLKAKKQKNASTGPKICPRTYGTPLILRSKGFGIPPT